MQVQGFEYGVSGTGFRDSGFAFSRFRVFEVQGFMYAVRGSVVFEVGVSGSLLRVFEVGVSGTGFWVYSFVYEVSGSLW